MNHKITFYLLMSLLVSSCSKMTVIDPYFFQNGMEEIHMKAIVNPSFPESKTFRVIDAYIDANLLYLQIQYKESCSGSDDFTFNGGELYIDERNIAHRTARLSIAKSNEDCDQVNLTKIIDLRALTSLEKRDAEVILHVGGWRTQMTYVYIPHKQN